MTEILESLISAASEVRNMECSGYSINALTIERSKRGNFTITCWCKNQYGNYYRTSILWIKEHKMQKAGLLLWAIKNDGRTIDF